VKSKQGKKRFPLPSGLDNTFAIPDNYSIGSLSEQHFVLEFELVLELVIPQNRNLLRSRLWLNAVKPTTENRITLLYIYRTNSPFEGG
jgi:hypothetical protein